MSQRKQSQWNNSCNSSSDQPESSNISRYSSHRQQEQSIDGQLRDCLCLLRIVRGYSVIAEYIDRALTVTQLRSPRFQRIACGNARKRRLKVYYCLEMDRFARNRYDSAVHKAELKKYGVRVYSATEKHSLTSGRESMLKACLNLSPNTTPPISRNTSARQREVLAGTYTGGIPPFGFKVENTKLVADENKAPIIRYVFEQYEKRSKNKS